MNYFKELYDKNALGYAEVEYEFFGGRLLTRLFLPLKSMMGFKTEPGKLTRQDVDAKDTLLKDSKLGELYGGVLSVSEVKEVGVIKSGRHIVISVRASEEVIVSQLEVEDFKRTVERGEYVDSVVLDSLTYRGSDVVSEFLKIIQEGRYETELIEFFNILGEESKGRLEEEDNAEMEDKVGLNLEDSLSIKGVEERVINAVETESKTGVMQDYREDYSVGEQGDLIRLDLDFTVEELFEMYILLDDSKLPNKETIKGKIRSKYLGR